MTAICNLLTANYLNVMRFFYIVLLCMGGLMAACGNYPGVPSKYHVLLDEALEKAGENRAELEMALKKTPKEQKEGMAFLIAYMPERDLVSLGHDYLLKNLTLAYAAHNRFPWAKAVPDSVFLNDVLPYVSLNETRDDWREDFYRRFSPYVENAQTLKEAILAVNKNIRDEVKVDYNTRRKKPDQSPTESMEIGMASCSGLSILLADALRSVGIPARVAGTAKWHDNRGNHTWVEVWLDGEWYFTEYYYKELDRAWFLADAGKAVVGDRYYAVWASSWKPTGISFPLVWDYDIDYVPAIDVSQHYIDVYQEVTRNQMASGDYVGLRVMLFKDEKHTTHSDDRVKGVVDIFQGEEQVGGGSTAGPTQDMNDMLEFMVEKNKEYTLKYWFPDGRAEERVVQIGDEPMTVKLY